MKNELSAEQLQAPSWLVHFNLTDAITKATVPTVSGIADELDKLFEATVMESPVLAARYMMVREWLISANSDEKWNSLTAIVRGAA